MPGNSVIGALRVSLGLDSAQFEAGLKQAQGKIAVFGKDAAIGLAAVGAAFVAVTAGTAVAVKGAIDHADALDKAAQKAGTTVEALSRLEYAAKFSDISLEDLTGSLGKLSKAMAEAVANPTSSAATAFKALGISVTDASGKLLPADEVFSRIADRFSRLEDGSTKTALAMQLFGKSGAQLIPLLNEGADGLKKFADESDRTGNTISTKTAEAANKFNDTLTYLGDVINGVVNRVIASDGLQGALDSLEQTLRDPKFAQSAIALGNGIAGGLDVVITRTSQVINLFDEIAAKLATLPKPPDWLMGAINSLNPAGMATDLIGAGLDVANGKAPFQVAAPKAPNSTGAKANDSDGSPPSTVATKLAPALVLPPFDTSKSATALNLLGDHLEKVKSKFVDLADTINNDLDGAVSGFVDEMMSGVNPLKAFADQLLSIAKDFASAAIKNGLSALLGAFGGAGNVFGGAAAAALGRNVAPSTFDFASFLNPGHNADGTSNWRGGLSWVGERGPELVNLPRGSQVIPASQAAGMGGFPAVLHPNETVVDHAAGQSMGGPPVIVNISTPDAASFQKSRAQITTMIAQAVGAASRFR